MGSGRKVEQEQLESRMKVSKSFDPFANWDVPNCCRFKWETKAWGLDPLKNRESTAHEFGLAGIPTS